MTDKMPKRKRRTSQEVREDKAKRAAQIALYISQIPKPQTAEERAQELEKLLQAQQSIGLEISRFKTVEILNRLFLT